MQPCNHDPFSAVNSLTVQPVFGGTRLSCSNCNSFATFDVSGVMFELTTYGDTAGTFADDSQPTEHIVLDGELAKWRCDFGNEHDLGEQCACTHL